MKQYISVTWNDSRPDSDTIDQIATQFISGAGTVKKRRDFVMVDLGPHGVDAIGGVYRDESRNINGRRWFEIWIHDLSIDVVLCDQDQFTISLGIGFSRMLARFSNGFVVIPSEMWHDLA